MINDGFKSWTCHVLNAMMTYVRPPAILTKIINDNAAFLSSSDGGEGGGGAHAYVDMKQLLLSMLETFSYEKVLGLSALPRKRNLFSQFFHC